MVSWSRELTGPKFVMDGTTRITKTRWLSSLLNRLSGKCIYLNDQPYLTRYYLWGNGSGNGLEVYLHILHQEDEGRWCHNHPWKWFLSIILKGQYTQEVIRPFSSDKGRKDQKLRFFNLFRNADSYHTITQVSPGGTWTLVVVPKKTASSQPWGYWNQETWSHEPDDGLPANNSETRTFGPKQLYD